MRSECDICRGCRVIRLPVYRPLTVTYAKLDAPLELGESSREFPCPQCCETVKVGQVGAIREETFGASQLRNDPGFIDHVKGWLVSAIGAQLLKSGYINFQSGPDSDFKFQMVATVGMVHPSKLDTLEQRIAERQAEVAKEVANEAARQIDN